MLETPWISHPAEALLIAGDVTAAETAHLG
jgi:hypothetical protein